MPTAQQEVLAALEAYKGGRAEQVAMLNPDLQKDWALSAGFQAYNLQPVALIMVPQLTPIRNMTPRVGGKGKQANVFGLLAA
jgi:hypothetical protein